MLQFTKGLQYAHKYTGMTQRHHWTASKHCHIPEEGGRAPQSDPMDWTWGQDDLGRLRGIGTEQLNCSPLPHKWAGKRETAGGSSEEATNCSQCSDKITHFSPWAICIRKCKLVHLRFGVFQKVTKIQKSIPRAQSSV